MFVRISGNINIRDINICLGSGLKDGHGQTTEGDSSDEDDEEYHTASFVSKGRAQGTPLYEQSEEVKHLRRRMTTKVRGKL